jgi:hypothetical protein
MTRRSFLNSPFYPGIDGQVLSPSCKTRLSDRDHLEKV